MLFLWHLQSGAPPTLIQAPSSSSTPNCLTWLWLCDHGHIKEVSKGVQLFNRDSLEGKPLIVNKTTPRGPKVERSSQVGSSNKIYVGNLPQHADDNNLSRLFSEHGNFLEARVVYDRECGWS